MKNFTIVAFALLMLFTTESIAQTPGNLTGTVTDNNNKILAGVTISLLHSNDSSLVKTTIQ
jgi:hypothetical protein